MVAKAKAVQETRRVYIDLALDADHALTLLAVNARVPKKRFLELLIEREVQAQKKKR